MNNLNNQSNKNYCTFYIVRHGETDWNKKGIIQGQSNKPKLTKKGYDQAKDLANIFKNIHFEAIFSSDLLRAKQTAEMIVLDQKIAIKTTKLLRERLFGKFEGKPQKLLRQVLQNQIKKKEALVANKRLNFRLAEGIETDKEIMVRFITFLREVAVAYPNKKILIVTHGGIIRSFLIYLDYVQYQQLPSGSIKNGGYIILNSDGVDFFVLKTVGIKTKK